MSAVEAIEALRRLHEGLDHMNYVYVEEHDGRLAGIVVVPVRCLPFPPLRSMT